MKCSKNKFIFLSFLLLDPSSLCQIVGNLTRNGVALMCFLKIFYCFWYFPMLTFFYLGKIWTKTFKFFHRFSFLSLRGYYSFAVTAGSLVIYEDSFLKRFLISYFWKKNQCFWVIGNIIRPKSGDRKTCEVAC